MWERNTQQIIQQVINVGDKQTTNNTTGYKCGRETHNK